MAVKKAGKKTVAKKKATTKKADSTTAKKGSWFQRGEAGIKKKHTIDSVNASKKERAVERGRLLAGETRKLVVVDDEPFYMWEHNLELSGRWGNYFTCVKEFMDSCRICQDSKRSTYTAYITVIDTKGYTKRDNSVVGPRRVLLPLKGSAMLAFSDLKKSTRGGLKGVVLEVKRYTAEDPNCGSAFRVLRKVKASEIKKIGQKHFKAFDYEKILAPPTDEEYDSLGLGSIVDTSVEAGDDSELDSDLEDIFGGE